MAIAEFQKNRAPMRRTEQPDDGRHRGLPHAEQAEQAFICSGLISGDILDEAGGMVKPEMLHTPAHKLIWEQVLAMHQERTPIDNVTLTMRLHNRQLLELAGGPAYVAELFTYLPTAANWKNYGDILQEHHLRREAIRICHQLSEQSYTGEQAPKEVLERGITQLVELAALGQGDESIVHVRKHAVAAMSEIEYAYENRGSTVGLPTGFVDLDRMIGGWQKGCTYYIGARPAMGKSSLGLNFAVETATRIAEEGAPTLFFTLEMTGSQLAKRALLSIAEINHVKGRYGMLSHENDWDRLTVAASQLINSRLYIDETAALTIADFRARARRWVKAQRRINGERKDGKADAVIVIDYLQRMKGSSARAETARYLELQEIAQGISIVAKELQIAIIVLAQLKRPKDKKPESEPDMSEFRECGDIEQEAHVVALIHRPHYYVKHNTEKQEALAETIQERMKAEAYQQGRSPDSVRFDVEDLKRYAKLLIDKQREGPVGPIDLRFLADYTKFETWDSERKLFSSNTAQRQVAHPQEDLEVPADEDDEQPGLEGLE